MLFVEFANRDPGFGNSRDLLTFLISRFPVFSSKIPGFVSYYTHVAWVKKKLQLFLNSIKVDRVRSHCNDTILFVTIVELLAVDSMPSLRWLKEAVPPKWDDQFKSN